VVWTGLIWLRIWTSGGPLWTQYWTFGFYKILGNSWVTAQLAVSQKGLSSTELLSPLKFKGKMFLSCLNPSSSFFISFIICIPLSRSLLSSQIQFRICDCHVCKDVKLQQLENNTTHIKITYCDEPLLCNERFSADVIAMATNTENQPISRDGYGKYYYRDNRCAFPRRPTQNNAFRKG
jgi:hypothetical protein